MKGDFSSQREERRHNFTGVLHQQGRVLLDSDWNAQTVIVNDWQDTAGRDIIGSGVAAIPSENPNGFKITKAHHDAGKDVVLTVTPGRLWADGLLAQLYGDPNPDVPSNPPQSAPDPEPAADVTRTATYLQTSAPTINAGDRDAVILELWREEISGFQMPAMLVEAALGGPDTTERVHTATAFRLMRLSAGEDCETIAGKLKDDWSKKGKLIVSLTKSTPGTGDCPTIASGGYTGFEHNLYRIEIADLDDMTVPLFKWSQYGGGLVGRGIFNANDITINANTQAIINSGLKNYYLELLVYDDKRGRWRVTYGADATLNGSVLSLTTVLFGNASGKPNANDTVFFRLWNGTAKIQDFVAQATLLPNDVGINLKFDAPAADNYKPGDYWTFDVRVPVGDNTNPDPLVNNEPPKGIHYHRVPLGVLHWKTATDADPIDDCRHIFQPLTKIATCCSYRVGDGIHSWGDFDSIQTAIQNLPAAGGEICVLPGEYKENVSITGKSSITIKGCGSRSRIVSPTPSGANSADPVIHIANSQEIRIESLALFAHDKGIGVLLEGPDMQHSQPNAPLLQNITLEKLYVEAATRCAIEAHVGHDVTIRGCDIEMSDEPSDVPGIFFAGDDSVIEDNTIRVFQVIGGISGSVRVPPTLDTDLFMTAEAAPGGLQIGGTSERVRVVNNIIQGGTGNGITLGTLYETADGQNFNIIYPGSKGIVDYRGKDLDLSQPPPPTGSPARIISLGALHDIYIERNLIYNMGANGIGVIRFFDLAKQDEFISVDRLTITGNEIRKCLNRKIAVIDTEMRNSMGYGAIALADVEYLVIRDNIIENNGFSHLMPVCGIYVLHGEGIEVSRNRILNNGANDGKPASGAMPGARGGIYINYGITPRVPSIPNAGPTGTTRKSIPPQSGVAAVNVYDNCVSAPLGQALALVALGPVSVVGNQFTSLGVVGSLESSTTWATTVLIFNMGLSNELYMQILAFSAVAQGQVRTYNSYQMGADNNTLFMPKPGLDDEILGAYLANGNVLFSNNQCRLDLVDEMKESAISSVLIASLDDISFHGNQCDCDLFLGDLIFTQAILFGISLRMTDNRFKEGIQNAWLSALTLGILNVTTDNQSTHCLMVLGLVVEDQPNMSLLDAFNRDICAPFRRIGKDFGKSPESANQPGGATQQQTSTGTATTTRSELTVNPTVKKNIKP